MKIKNDECAIFLRELNETFKAGLSGLESIDIILPNVDSKVLSDGLLIAKENLLMGDSLSDSFEKAGCFDSYLIEMLRLGENTGYLDKTIDELYKYYDRKYQAINKVKQAIIYPSIILFMMIVVMLVVVIKVLPIFNDVLAMMGTGLTDSALLLMNIGDIMAKYGLLAIVLIIILILAYVLFMYFKHKENFLLAIFNHNPITSKLALSLDKANFSFGLSLLINSGYDDVESLRFLLGLINNQDMKNKINQMIASLENGESLVDVLCMSGILNKLSERMLRVGYKSGQFEKAINDMAIKSEEELEITINKYLNAIEPSIIVLCSVIIGFILLSVMLPILGVMSSI